MGHIKSDETRAATGEIPSGAEMLAWEVVYGESRRSIGIGNMLANDIGRISTGASNGFVRLMSQNLGEDEFFAQLRALRERLTMMEAVARPVIELRAER